MSQKSIQICRKMPRFHPHWKPCMQNLHGDVWMAPGRPLNEFGGKQTEPGGGFKYFWFLPQTLGKIPILTHIFQRGWNQQPEKNRKPADMCFSQFIFWRFWRQKTLKSFGTDSQLLNPTFPPNFPKRRIPPEKMLDFIHVDGFVPTVGYPITGVGLEERTTDRLCLVFFAWQRWVAFVRFDWC